MDTERKLLKLETEFRDFERRFNNFVTGIVILIFAVVLLILIIHAFQQRDKSQQILNDKIANPPGDIRSYCIGKVRFISDEINSHSYMTNDDLETLSTLEGVYKKCVKEMVELEETW
jgi:uncharacterized membrane protein (DUF485 family)